MLDLLNYVICLNPLSTGKSVQTRIAAYGTTSWLGLNPLSTGKSVQTMNQNIMDMLDCLNPLSTGKSVQT